MERQGAQGFWTNMAGQRPATETDSARSPTAVLSGPPDDPMVMVTPAPRPRQSDSLLDAEKTGAALLFSGALLALVGVFFTTMGWQHYQANSSFAVTQLLGPVLISVGGTFMLTSVCKFGVAHCWPCRWRDEEVLVRPVIEQTLRGHSCTLHGINQPSIMLHSATTMVCIPPPYNFITQEVHQTIEFQPGIHAALPPHDGVYCVDNAAFTAEEDSCRETDDRRSRLPEISHLPSISRRIEKTEDERGRGEESGSTCSRPPAYEDIYPSFNKHSPP
ncbi:transmembrane protein 174 [Seriola aureovittata]|uniref:transmembrane protein 174 n=1 Tax=Seriola aureovittata TaxID=2871759 RepID=UPI0024BDFC6B|nr:transmembrane protein 174 [Seriola aureovittata]